MQQRRDAAIEKVGIRIQGLKSTILVTVLLAYVCVPVSFAKSVNASVSTTTVHSGQLDCSLSGHENIFYTTYKVASISFAAKPKRTVVSVHWPILQTVRPLKLFVKLVLKRFLPREVALRQGVDRAPGTCYVQWDFAPLPQKLLIKARESFSIFFPTFRCLLFVFDKRQDDSRSPRLSFNHIQIACYVQFNFLGILPRIPSDGFKAGLMQRWTLMRLLKAG